MADRDIGRRLGDDGHEASVCVSIVHSNLKLDQDAPTAIFQLIEKHKLSLNDHVFGPGAVLGAALLGLFAAAIVPVAVGVVLFSRLFSATSRHLAGSPAAGSAVATDSSTPRK